MMQMGFFEVVYNEGRRTVVTPLGNDVDTLWNNLIAGKLGIGPITRFEKECAESWMRYLANIRMMYFDARAVFWYLSVIELNILNVRMVLSGLQGGVAPEIIKERLRQTYV